MTRPWNNWYHCVGNTYGTWLPGDPRGWRSWKHHEHVDGDYKNPPPKGKYDKLHARSQKLMRRQKIELTPEERQLACRTLVTALQYHVVELIVLAVGRKHFHMLARFQQPPGRRHPVQVPIPGLKPKPPSTIRTPRHLVGIAKKNAARAISDAGLRPYGGVWGKRMRPRPIKNRAHQVRVAGYIRDHYKENAVIWLRGKIYIPPNLK